MPRILIVGAGFVGLSTARRVRASLPKATVTLIDTKDTFLFTPRLIDALENPDYPRSSLRADLRTIAKRDGFDFIQGRVTAIDRETRTITYATATSKSRSELLAYDVLVLAHGAQPCFYNIAGANEYALPLKTEEDVHHIHHRVQHLLDQASQASSDEERKRLMSFVAVGAGPSGVEAMCALKLMVEDQCQHKYPALIPHLSWTLIQGGPQILPGFPTSLVEQARLLLEKQAINIRTGEVVSDMEEGLIKTAQATYPAGLVLWTAGIEPNKIQLIPAVHTDRAGYLPVDQFLQISPNIFAAGDVIHYQESNVVIPKNAQTAMSMAKTLSINVVRAIRQQPLQSFHYLSKGNVLTVGKNGFLDIKYFVFQTRLTPFIRNLLYRLRFRQMTGM